MPIPPANATRTTLQLGTWAPNTDTFTTVLDLNDQVNWWVEYQAYTLNQPSMNYSEGTNLRTLGSNIARSSYGTMDFTVILRTQGASAAAVLANCETLFALVNAVPYTVRIAPPGALIYHYLDVTKVTFQPVYDPLQLLAKAQKGLQVTFTCTPGFRRDRQIIQNLWVNPSANTGAGPAVPVYTDTTFPNFNPYAVQAGSLSNDKTYFPDVLGALSGAAGASSTTLNLLRYYRMDQTSGSAAFDAASQQTGTISATGVTLGVAGLLTGDSDQCMTFTGSSSGQITVPTTGMPTGNSPISLGAVVKISATPSATAGIWMIGTPTSSSEMYIGILSTGKATLYVKGVNYTAASALSTGTPHLIVGTWDGTTATLYVDGVSVASGTPGAATIAYGVAVIGSLSGANYFTGQIDEAFLFTGCLSSTQVGTLWTTASTTPVANAASMLIAATGRIQFGNPGWANYNLAQLRFRYAALQTATVYLHYTDANNYLAVTITGAGMTLMNAIGGTVYTLATQTLVLIPGIQYWLQWTQFPTNISGSPFVIATVYSDVAGNLGTTLGAINNVFTAGFYEYPSTVVGVMQLASAGAAMGITSISIQQFGPGGWSFTNQGGTGLASGAWEQNTANCYSGGPVQSYGAARIDCAPAGTVSARWASGFSGSNANMVRYGIPATLAQGHSFGFATWVKGPALGANAVVTLGVLEFDINGNFLTFGTATSHTGPISAWTQLSGSYMPVNGNTAFILPYVGLADTTSGSAGATLWIDNCQAWDVTYTGQTTMPYAEMRFDQTPAQINVSGIVGGMLGKAILMPGLYYPGAWTSTTLYLGRRATAYPTSQLVQLITVGTIQPVLDTASYNGWYVPTTTGTDYVGAALGQLVQAALGSFNVLSRIKILGAATPANVPVYAQSQIDTTLYTYASVYPFTANNIWYAVDLGYAPPVFNQPSVAAVLSNQVASTNLYSDATSHQTLANYLALFPTDAEKHIVKLANPINGNYGPTWVHTYIDAYALSTTLTFDTSVVANAPFAIIGGGNATTEVSATSVGDPIPYVDPQSANGLLQYLLSALDNNGNPLPCSMELWYWPRDLYL
jgi:hypothetical protein